LKGLADHFAQYLLPHTRAEALLHNAHRDLAGTEARQPDVARRFLETLQHCRVNSVCRDTNGDSSL
jgi:hypothetical protein